MQGATTRLLVGVLVTAFSLTAFGGAAQVQALDLPPAANQAVADDPPPPGPVILPPAAIHEGTCANPAPEPAYDLGDLRIQQVRPVVEAGPPEDASADGDEVLDKDWDAILPGATDVPLPPEILKTEAEVDATFDDLFGAPHVVAVHQNAVDYGTLIACGDLAAANREGAGEAVIGLRPLNASNYYGYAVLEQDTGDVPVLGENTTGVTVYLFQGLSTIRGRRITMATPPATPAD